MKPNMPPEGKKRKEAPHYKDEKKEEERPETLETLGVTLKEVVKQLKTVNKRFDRLERALLPVAPALLHSPLKRLKCVIPHPGPDNVVTSTWTMVDLADGISLSGQPSMTTRCLLGSRHCAIPLFFNAKMNSGTSTKFAFFVELNEDILRREVTSVGVLKPGVGNLTLGQSLNDARVVPDLPDHDVMYINVKNATVDSDSEVPQIPHGSSLAKLNNSHHRDKCLVGRSLHSDVSGHYGLHFKINVGRMPGAATQGSNASVENDASVFETGSVKFVMSRCERGNNGTVLYVVDASSSVPLYAVGVLFGLNSAHCSAGHQHMLSRGVVAVCPQKKAFTDCPVVGHSFLGDGLEFDAIVGYDSATSKVEIARVKMELVTSNPSLNVVRLSYQYKNTTKTHLGVMCQSDTQVTYCHAAGMAFSPDVYAFG